MIYCRGCQKDVDPNDMDESIYIEMIYEDVYPSKASVVIDLTCPDCERTLLDGNGEVDLY